ncbi:MAG: CpsD/CapB family tyrosine-protein kinase [Chloroflexi bacterium]|nr:CpsD/CapB family tyrosine-protein kinase [Chloroflexota bacterium]
MADPRILAELPDGEALAEGFVELRANALVALDERTQAIVTVTSPHSEEPRRHVAAHLAAALAQTGRRVLLVDADVDGAADEGESEAHTVPEHLSAVTAEAVRAGDPALLSGAVFLAWLRGEAEAHDLVIVAGPPLLDVPDGRALAAQADGVLLAVVHARTNRDDAIRARAILREAGANLLGAVVVEG